MTAVSEPAFAQTSGARDPAASLAKRLFWALSISKAAPAASETLYVLMHSSKDCPYCTRWKRDPTGLGKANTIVDKYPNVRIFIVERDSLKTSERKTQYPDQLLFEYERRLAADELTPGVPLFEIYLRGEAVYRASGLDNWVDRVIPAIDAIESRREGIRTQPEAAPNGAAQEAPK